MDFSWLFLLSFAAFHDFLDFLDHFVDRKITITIGL